jgi:hypothetical protein
MGKWPQAVVRSHELREVTGEIAARLPSTGLVPVSRASVARSRASVNSYRRLTGLTTSACSQSLRLGGAKTAFSTARQPSNFQAVPEARHEGRPEGPSALCL